MDALIVAQARRTVSLLWDDVPTGTDPDELETSLCLHLTAFQQLVDDDRPGDAARHGERRLNRLCRQAKLMYDTDVRQIHHTLADELFLRYLLELTLVNVLARPGDLRTRVKKHHRLVTTAADCLPRIIFIN